LVFVLVMRGNWGEQNKRSVSKGQESMDALGLAGCGCVWSVVATMALATYIRG
jgi:hypothetical protein